MIRSPILKVLSSMNSNGVQCLLMGGQACVLYGAAEFSRDTDLALLASPDNLLRLQAAFWLRELRTPSLLLEVARRFPQPCAEALPHRPLLHTAVMSDESALRRELAAEEQREREADRAYWAPLRRQLEALRAGRRST